MKNFSKIASVLAMVVILEISVCLAAPTKGVKPAEGEESDLKIAVRITLDPQRDDDLMQNAIVSALMEVMSPTGADRKTPLFFGVQEHNPIRVFNDFTLEMIEKLNYAPKIAKYTAGTKKAQKILLVHYKSLQSMANIVKDTCKALEEEAASMEEDDNDSNFWEEEAVAEREAAEAAARLAEVRQMRAQGVWRTKSMSDIHPNKKVNRKNIRRVSNTSEVSSESDQTDETIEEEPRSEKYKQLHGDAYWASVREKRARQGAEHHENWDNAFGPNCPLNFLEPWAPPIVPIGVNRIKSWLPSINQ